MVEAGPVLMVISDAARYGAEATVAMARRVCEEAATGGVVVQLRDVELPFMERQDLGERLGAITRATGQLLSVNDRLDLAYLLRAQAIHLPERGLPSAKAREFFAQRGDAVWLSRAWHGQDVAPVGNDAVVLSPLFAARKERAMLGVPAFQRLATRLGAGVRAFALGGITADNAQEALDAGASGVAVIGAAYSQPGKLLAALGLARTS